MSNKPADEHPAKPAPDNRRDRLKAALKANMARRKAQAQERARQQPPGDTTQERDR